MKLRKLAIVCAAAALIAVGTTDFAPQAHAMISQPACSDLGDCIRVSYWWYFLR
jgi:hypothetical protein